MSSNDSTVTTQLQHPRPERDDASALALVIAWSSHEPNRIGEVAFLPECSDGAVLGRGRGRAGDAARLAFLRQRPGTLEPRPPLEGPALSREQLFVMAKGEGLLVRRIGRCPLLVDGQVADEVLLLPGGTLLLAGQMLLYCVRRPRLLAPLRYYPLDRLPRFGEADEMGFVGEGSAAWALRDQVAFAAAVDQHVLITGASGTGKELVAHAVHRLSCRSSHPIVARNAATLPTSLLDAELFGHAKDYPNSGMPQRPGLIGEADRSTLFLDEIAEMSEEGQAHLLRVLDASGEYRRLGEAAVRHSNFRVLGATNRDPDRLKPDFLARFKIRVHTATLQQRREDIPLLVRHVLRRIAQRTPDIAARFFPDGPSADGSARVSVTLIDKLLHHEYPGQVRELEVLLLQAIRESPGAMVEDLPTLKVSQPIATLSPTPPRRAPTREEVLASHERQQGNRERMWRELGLKNRFQLYRLLDKYGVGVSDSDPELDSGG